MNEAWIRTTIYFKTEEEIEKIEDMVEKKLKEIKGFKEIDFEDSAIDEEPEERKGWHFPRGN